jgi:hypothetical protein
MKAPLKLPVTDRQGLSHAVSFAPRGNRSDNAARFVALAGRPASRAPAESPARARGQKKKLVDLVALRTAWVPRRHGV